jgi:hypothetical protein
MGSIEEHNCLELSKQQVLKMNKEKEKSEKIINDLKIKILNFIIFIKTSNETMICAINALQTHLDELKEFNEEMDLCSKSSSYICDVSNSDSCV